MSRFKKLKSLFITEDENAKQAAPKKQAQPKEKPTVKPTSQAPATQNAPAKPTIKGKASPKFTERLLKVIEAHNQEGFDYLEFKQTLKAMGAMQMDEAVMYKSAYAAAQSMGTTPVKLVESVQHYLNVLDQEEKKFVQVLERQTEKNIGGRQQALKAAEARMKAKEEQIKKLQEEIAAENQQLASTRKELGEVTEKINTTKADFMASYNSLKSQMMADVKKINQYLSA